MLVLYKLLDKIKKPSNKKPLKEIMNEFSFHSIKDEVDKNKQKNTENLLNFDILRKDFEAQKELNEIDLNIYSVLYYIIMIIFIFFG